MKHLNAHHKNGTITIVSSFYAETYVHASDAIEKDGLLKPNMSELASILYDTLPFSIEHPEIKRAMESIGIWAFTGILYVPKVGAYIQDNPKIERESIYMEESELIKNLEANDPNVRFVKFGYKTGDMSSFELANNPFIRTLAGGDGAEKLAYIASRYKGKPCLYADQMFIDLDHPVARVSKLGLGWEHDYRDIIPCGKVRLDIDCIEHSSDSWLDYPNGSQAFGIKKHFFC